MKPGPTLYVEPPSSTEALPQSLTNEERILRLESIVRRLTREIVGYIEHEERMPLQLAVSVYPDLDEYLEGNAKGVEPK